MAMENFTFSPSAGSVNDLTRALKDSAASVQDAAKDVASREAEAGAQRVADSAQNLADALRSAADAVPLESKWVGELLGKSADGIERATSSLSSGDFSGALHDVNGFARRQPAIFLGACVALGFAAARVGKTALEQTHSAAPENGSA
jgi:hypothetical protein